MNLKQALEIAESYPTKVNPTVEALIVLADEVRRLQEELKDIREKNNGMGNNP